MVLILTIFTLVPLRYILAYGVLLAFSWRSGFGEGVCTSISPEEHLLTCIRD